VVKTRSNLQATFTALSSEFKTEMASIRRGPSWRPELPETFPGKSKQDPTTGSSHWTVSCFFDDVPELRNSTASVAFAASSLRNDALKWWRQSKTSVTSEEHDFDAFKAQLCSRFRTTDPVKDARDQLAELKQINSVKAYSSFFRTVALIVIDLPPAESLDQYLQGLEKHITVQALLQKRTKTEDAMRLAEIYDP